MKITPFLEKRSKWFWLVTGLLLVAFLGLIDYMTGYEIAFSLLYLVPITLVTWFAGRRMGVLDSLAGGLSWYLAELAAGRVYASPLILYWNTLTRLTFFLIVTFLLAALRKALEDERELARTDYLTGVANQRFFYELAEQEINRSARYLHPFTVAYIDLDNFKIINDRFGHFTGDLVLRAVADRMKGCLRKTDGVGRLGGDEFAVLFSETGPEAARAAVSKLRVQLLAEMHQGNWPVTFSIGVTTFITAPPSVDEMIRLTDELMYTVKKEHKNAVAYEIYEGIGEKR
jgi:diguanylate cyclase (GGDEF)-like protein